jgi:GTP cyclohydrolase II
VPDVAAGRQRPGERGLVVRLDRHDREPLDRAGRHGHPRQVVEADLVAIDDDDARADEHRAGAAAGDVGDQDVEFEDRKLAVLVAVEVGEAAELEAYAPDAGPEPALVRVQVADPLRDVFQASTSPLDRSLAAIAAAGRGVLVYLAPEPDGGPAQPATSQAATLRTYGTGAQILAALHYRQLRLLTSNPRRIPGLEGFSLEVVEHVPL